MIKKLCLITPLVVCLFIGSYANPNLNLESKISQIEKIKSQNDKLEAPREGGLGFSYHWTWKFVAINNSGRDFNMKPVNGGDFDDTPDGFRFKNGAVWAPSQIKWRDPGVTDFGQNPSIRLEVFNDNSSKSTIINVPYNKRNGTVLIIKNVESTSDNVDVDYKTIR